MDKGGKKNPKDYYKKALTLADLKPGDILTFEGEENDTISFLIQRVDSLSGPATLKQKLATWADRFGAV